jgi:hypothetical protein
LDDLTGPEREVETYRSRMMQKLGLDDLPALVNFALRNGLAALDQPLLAEAAIVKLRSLKS